MKLAISGKGGVGKTTLAALLAQVYADAGRQVLAVDADPSPCLEWLNRASSFTPNELNPSSIRHHSPSSIPIKRLPSTIKAFCVSRKREMAYSSVKSPSPFTRV